MEEPDVEIILQRARESYPEARPRINSDNGPQFIAKDFKEFIREAGMSHVKTSPYYPQSNGKIERWHKTLNGDCIRPQVPLSLEEARRLVADFVAHYNTVRLHSAIGYVTPQNKLDGKDKEIFAQRDRKLEEARERRRKIRQETRDNQTKNQLKSNSSLAIDFAAVRAAISLAAVLDCLGFQPLSRTGNQKRGPCPLYGSSSATARCFSANLDKNVFLCFKCGRSGNALDLWAQATKQNPYDAAIDLCNRLAIPVPLLDSQTEQKRKPYPNNSNLVKSQKPQLEAVK